MSNLSDKFRIGNYAKQTKPISEFVDDRETYNMNFSYNHDKLCDYENWADENNIIVIQPCNFTEELDQLWIDFCSQPKKIRDLADQKCVELIGFTNQFFYEAIRSRLLTLDVPQMDLPNDTFLMQFLGEGAETNEGIVYGAEDIESGIKWSSESGYPLIYPVATEKELDNLWDNFNSYPKEVRRDADFMSIELFGCNNQTHYEYLKRGFMNQNLPPVPVTESFQGDLILTHRTFGMNENVNAFDKASDLLGLISKKNEAYEDAIIGNIIDKSTDSYIASNQNLKYDIVPGEDLPFFTPEELIDAGVNSANPEDNFYGCEPANVLSENDNYQQWFEDYSNFCNGLIPFDSIDWINRIRVLQNKMNKAENKYPYKQAILSLGWPAESEFSPENRIIATARLKDSIKNDGSIQFVDLTGIEPEDLDSFSEAAESKDLKPVYIVLISGKTMFSKAIKKFTHSEFSHAAISFDPSLHKMWSYGIADANSKKISLKGGFIQEDIDNDLPLQRLSVFAIFLKQKDWAELKKQVEKYIDHAKDTSYSYLNLVVSHLLKVDMDRDLKLVCSQFVDKILKAIDLDITKVPSSLVSPATLDRAAKENRKIYTLFDGRVMQYDGNRVGKIINSLLKKNSVEAIKEMTSSIEMAHYLIHNIHSISKLRSFDESVTITDPQIKKIYESMIRPCLYAEAYLLEAKDSPIKFDKDGNLFIKNVKKRDYEGEYAKSHKLLRAYKEAGNIEGMKYELCKLWVMNSTIESKINSKKFKELPSMAIESSAEVKARAKILNDFKYFLGEVLKVEPDFNFDKYFKDSPFNDAMTKISGDTIKWSTKLLKAFVLPL